MKYNKFIALCLVAMTVCQAATLPQHPVYTPELYSQHSGQQISSERKFAEKPNVSKKVGLEDVEVVGSNQENSVTGFSWSNMLGMLMQMLLGQPSGVTGPSKNDIDDGVPASPWANLLSVGLRVLTAILGGTQQPVDGIDKVDNQGNPMHFINIVMNLLDALKTSFSQRSSTARTIGKRDTISEAGVASISMLKGYMRSMKSFNHIGRSEDESQRGCAERALCEASAECVADTHGTSTIFCQLGSYATSYLLQRQSGVGFEALYEAGRRGRSGEDCRGLFMDCNAI